MTVSIDPIVIVAAIIATLVAAAAIGWFLIWRATDRAHGQALENSPLLRRADDHSWTERKKDQPGTIYTDPEAIAGDPDAVDWEAVRKAAGS